MSRAIDRLPAPSSPRRIKVVIPSASRSGTMGLYQAMKILGYRPFHMMEVALQGAPGAEILCEGIVACQNRLSGIQPWSKTDLDKWLDDYDCLVELPFMLGLRSIEPYIHDPEVKFILTERDPNRWAKSINATIGPVAQAGFKFPMNMLKYFDRYLYYLFLANALFYRYIGDGTKPDQKGNREALGRNYTEYNQMIKTVVPKERLLVIKLEDGLGWEQICPFLGTAIPDADYPGKNDPAEFEAQLKAFVEPKVRNAILKAGAVAAPIVGGAVWAVLKYSPLWMRWSAATSK
ncbi:hypothetical protein GQ53DRAFT_648852 [Thozetella sp. PMI_491]|nr:hypothetical protein GQ53DRAFT_648852 [Thozetella sp. PMI_491]